jgi:hypothetical protein
MFLGKSPPSGINLSGALISLTLFMKRGKIVGGLGEIDKECGI